MNKVTKLVITTQLLTTIAFTLAFIADVIDKHANPQWQFITYVLLALSAILMLLPHIFHNDTVTIKDESKCIQLNNPK